MKPNTGRVLSAAGAVLLLVSLALIWYRIDFPTGVQAWTAWHTFPRLRWIVAGAALLTLASAVPPQVRWVVLARTALGVLVAALIVRRIIDPPPLSSPMHAQAGLYIGLLAAVVVALGGLVDTGRRVIEGGLSLGGPGLPQLPPGPPAGAAVRVANEAERSRWPAR
jgi:peptidoglycan/LPS O-acetylase OafA/YrhL